MNIEEACRVLDMGVASLYRYRRDYPDFPRPFMQGGRAWYSLAELEAWKAKYMTVDPQ